MSACNTADGTTVPSASQAANLLSQLESLNHSITRTLQMLQDRRPLNQRRTSNGGLEDTGNFELSIRSCSKLVQLTRGNIRNLDTQLKYFEDRRTTYTRSQRPTNEKDEDSISVGGETSLARDIVDGRRYTKSNPGNQKLWPWPLEREAYQRYGRQLIMPEIGLQGMLLSLISESMLRSDELISLCFRSIATRK